MMDPAHVLSPVTRRTYVSHSLSLTFGSRSWAAVLQICTANPDADSTHGAKADDRTAAVASLKGGGWRTRGKGGVKVEPVEC